MPEQVRFVSRPQAGKLLGKGPVAIKRMISKGLLSVIRIPGCHDRVPLAEIEAYVPAGLSQEQGKTPGVRGRPFPPGVSGNPLGRPPGTGKKQGPQKNLSVGTDRNG